MKKICFLNGNMSRAGGTERVTSMIANELVKDSAYEIHVLSVTKGEPRVKKICFLNGNMSRAGGTERVTSMIANELVKDSAYEIHVLSVTNPTMTSFFELHSSVYQATLLRKEDVDLKYDYFKIVKKLRRYLKTHQIDILIEVDVICNLYTIPATCWTKVKTISWEHFNYYSNNGSRLRDLSRKLILIEVDVICNLYTIPATCWTKVKTISWEHFNYYSNNGSRLRDLSRKLTKYFSTHIVTLTEQDRRNYQEHLGIKDKITCIYNPIEKIPETMYQSESKQIISVGRLMYQKGFDMLCEVAKEVLTKHSDWTWLIIGEGAERPMLEKKIKEYHLEGRLVLTGNQKEMSHYYQESAFFVMTSRYEGLPMTLLEAKSYRLPHLEGRLVLTGNQKEMSHYYQESAFFVMTSRYEGLPMTLLEAKSYRLPIISFDCQTGPAELILPSESGYLVQMGDQKMMEQKVTELIENPSLRVRFSSNTLKDIKRFEMDEVIRKWISLLEGV